MARKKKLELAPFDASTKAVSSISGPRSEVPPGARFLHATLERSIRRSSRSLRSNLQKKAHRFGLKGVWSSRRWSKTFRACASNRNPPAQNFGRRS